MSTISISTLADRFTAAQRWDSTVTLDTLRVRDDGLETVNPYRTLTRGEVVKVSRHLRRTEQRRLDALRRQRNRDAVLAVATAATRGSDRAALRQLFG